MSQFKKGALPEEESGEPDFTEQTKETALDDSSGEFIAISLDELTPAVISYSTFMKFQRISDKHIVFDIIENEPEKS